MSQNINEVRERLDNLATYAGHGGSPGLGADLRAILDDHARLQKEAAAGRMELTNGQIAQLAAFAGTPAAGTPMDEQDVLIIQHKAAGHSGAGIYAWFDDCPEDGAIYLDGKAVQP